MTYGFFTDGTYPRHDPCLSRLSPQSNHPCQPPSPDHSPADSSVTWLSPCFRYYSVVRLLTWLRFPLRSAYRVTYSGATRKPCESSWGHTLIFHTVPPANTLVRWVDENAFASILQARPCPTFGRPVRPRMAPLTTARYFSSNPSDPTSRWTPCPPVVLRQNANLGVPLVVSSVSGFVPV